MAVVVTSSSSQWLPLFIAHRDAVLFRAQIDMRLKKHYITTRNFFDYVTLKVFESASRQLRCYSGGGGGGDKILICFFAFFCPRALLRRRSSCLISLTRIDFATAPAGQSSRSISAAFAGATMTVAGNTHLSRGARDLLSFLFQMSLLFR